MTLEELITLCDKAEEEQSSPAKFSVIVPGRRYGRTVKVAPGLTGENFGDCNKGTMVFLEVPKVRKWIEFVQSKQGKAEGDRPTT